MDISQILYFDNQATTPVADKVFEKMLPYFKEYFGNPHSADHVMGWKSADAVDNAAHQIANLIGSDPDEIIFTSGATESNNLSILGLAKHAFLSGDSRRRILLSAIEHKCVLSVGHVLKEQFGFTVDSIPVNGEGFIVTKELERLLDNDVLLVSIMAVNNEIGSIQNISEMSGIIRTHDAVFHCDAAQAPMAITIDDIAQKVDLLSLSGHKMYGPKGVGALYIRRDIQNQIEPLIYGGGQQNGLRSGTLPTPLCVGMGAAAEYISSDEVVQNREKIGLLRKRFLKHLLDLPWPVRIYGPQSDRCHSGNLSIGFEGFDAKDILGALQPFLAASTGSACTSGIPEPSHVLKAISLTTKEANSVIRFSLGIETTENEIERAIKLIKKVLERLSN